MEKNTKETILKLIDESLERVKENRIVYGTVASISSTEVFVDIGYKSEGSVPLTEFDDPGSLKIGDKFEFFLEKIVENEGIVFLSKRKADSIRIWEDIEKSYEAKVPIEANVIKSVKGGVIVDIKGIEAFLPGSQLDVVEVKDTSKYSGETMLVRVTKFDKIRNNVVVSRKVILEEELQKKREEIWESVKEGEIVEGVVKSIVDFGAFVDIGGVDGLIHIADLSWGRVIHPSEILRVGQKIKVKVLGIDKEEGHLSLGIKQLVASPWKEVENRYPVGAKVKGKVTSLTEYGAFIELEPGVEGLLHISEMSWSRIHSPSDILTVGDTAQVMILHVDREEEKISLGLRQLQPNPWEEIAERYTVDSVVTGTVKSFSRFGAFIELEEGVEGLLHVKDLSWTEHIEHPGDILSKKQQVKCKILNVDVMSQRITLGLKQLEKDPLLILKDEIDTPVKGKVKDIIDKGLIVKLQVGKYKVDGFVPLSHLVRQAKKRVKAKYEVGEDLDLKLLEVDEERRRVILSEKEYQEVEEQKEYEEYLKSHKNPPREGE